MMFPREMEPTTRESGPLPITLFGSDICDDTDTVRHVLVDWEIQFREFDVEADIDAKRYVMHVNHGYCSTPTLVFGQEAFIVVEPTRYELIIALRRAGYDL